MSQLSPRVLQAVDLFFSPEDRPAVVEQLQHCDCPETARVQVAILVITAGHPEEVAHYVREANCDYRDVLYWAEFSGMPGHTREFRARYRRLRQNNP